MMEDSAGSLPPIPGELSREVSSLPLRPHMKDRKTVQITCELGRPLLRGIGPATLATLCKMRPILDGTMRMNAAYRGLSKGQRQKTNVFKQHATTGCDQLEYSQVRDALRCALRITPSLISDAE